jgi:ElaB/YqjD/DUF883 family membrane-anchored ribosome-binding protein
MFNPPPTLKTDLADPAAGGADAMLDRAAAQGQDALHRLGHEVEGFATRSAGQLRRQATAVQDMTAREVQTHPLRSVLLAAGAGALLTLLLRQLLRR